jgi:hypothetical protein
MHHDIYNRNQMVCETLKGALAIPMQSTIFIVYNEIIYLD